MYPAKLFLKAFPNSSLVVKNDTLVLVTNNKEYPIPDNYLTTPLQFLVKVMRRAIK